MQVTDTSALQKQLEDRLSFIDRFCGPTIKAQRKIFPNVPLLVVARKWSSWYPSYFEVNGGCYALIDVNSDVTVIDPGFNFLTTLRSAAQIEPQDIKHLVVTHFHPDHSAGLQQFLTFAFEANLKADLFLNETSYYFYKDFHGDRIRIHELAPGKIFRIPALGRPSEGEGILVTPFPTHHSEIGLRHRALGLQIDLCPHDRSNRVVFLGDTDGRDEYLDEYLRYIDSRTKVVVLHLGTFANPPSYGSGTKHLYRRGIENLLDRMGERIRDLSALELVLVSEFGFEMASRREIIDNMKPFYGPRKDDMILFMVSSLIGKSSEFEKFLFSHLTYKSIVENASRTLPSGKGSSGRALTGRDICRAWCEVGLVWSTGVLCMLSTNGGVMELDDWVAKHVPKAVLEDDIEGFGSSKEFEEIKYSDLGEDLKVIVNRLFQCSGDAAPATITNISAFGKRLHDLSVQSLRVLSRLKADDREAVEEDLTNAIHNMLEVAYALGMDKRLGVTHSYGSFMKLTCLSGAFIRNYSEDMKKDSTVHLDDLRYNLAEDVCIPIEVCKHLQTNTKLGKNGIPILAAGMGATVSFGKGLTVVTLTGEMVPPSKVVMKLDDDLNIRYDRS